ncbi:MAG: hypothetical protein WBQ50_12715, partial [Nocardioides sp.]
DQDHRARHGLVHGRDRTTPGDHDDEADQKQRTERRERADGEATSGRGEGRERAAAGHVASLPRAWL